MNRQLSQLAFCALTFFIALASGTPVSADPYRQINRFARRIENTAASIARESTFFVRSPHYGCLVNETHQLRQLACHVRDTARTGCDLQRLQSDVVALGDAYSRLNAKLCLIEQVNPTCPRARRMRRLLDSVQRDIQKVVSSVTCLLNTRPQVLQPQVNEPILPSHGYNYGPIIPGYQYQTPGFVKNHGTGFGTSYRSRPATVYGMSYGNGISVGYSQLHDNLSHNAVRYPTVPGVQRQLLQRSASLESQLRSMRSPQGETLDLGGGRFSISF